MLKLTNHFSAIRILSGDCPTTEDVIDLTGSDDEGDYNYEPEDSKEGLQNLKKAMEAEIRVNEQHVKNVSAPVLSSSPASLSMQNDTLQPIALTVNRANSPQLPVLAPPLPPSPPSSNHSRDRPFPPVPPENPLHMPPPPSSPPPPPLPQTPPSLRDRVSPPLPPAAHQHHPTPSPYIQPFDLSTNSKLTPSSAPSSSLSSPPSSALPPLPHLPPPFPFNCLPGFLPTAFHPANPFFGAAASYEAWAHLHSAPDATAAGMIDFFSMMHAAAGMPDFAAGLPDYSAAAAAAFGAMNPFAMSGPALMDYFYRSVPSSASHMDESSSSSHRGTHR